MFWSFIYGAFSQAVGLALFSDRVLWTEKAKIVEGMTTTEPSERKVRGDDIKLKDNVFMENFATKRLKNYCWSREYC